MSEQENKMLPINKYMINAAYEWIIDSGSIPYIHVNAEIKGVEVPTQFIKDGQIILDISMGSTSNLSINQNEISFNASFGGKKENIFIPMSAVVAIFPKHGGGVIQLPEMPMEQEQEQEEQKQEPEKKKPVGLRIVK